MQVYSYQAMVSAAAREVVGQEDHQVQARVSARCRSRAAFARLLIEKKVEYGSPAAVSRYLGTWGGDLPDDPSMEVDTLYLEHSYRKGDRFLYPIEKKDN